MRPTSELSPLAFIVPMEAAGKTTSKLLYAGVVDKAWQGTTYACVVVVVEYLKSLKCLVLPLSGRSRCGTFKPAYYDL